LGDDERCFNWEAEVLMKIFITGGAGLLGKELIKNLQTDNTLYWPTHKECDIEDRTILRKHIEKFKPEILIHCAAFISIGESEKDPSKAIDANVIGTCNVVQECSRNNIKLIYISTTHVFDGKKGNYTIDDYINPLGNYAKTKAAGELVVRTYKNSLSIRTEFFGHDFPYPAAFTDRWASKDYIDVIAPKIASISLSNKTGICNVGSPRKTLYEIAKQRKKDVDKLFVKDFGQKVPILIDTSLKL